MRWVTYVLWVAWVLCVPSRAQVSFTGAPYTQNFNSLAGATNNTLDLPFTNNSTLPGWYSTRPTYTVTDGTLGGSAVAFDSTSTAAQNVGLFSFGAAGSVERALGSRATASFAGHSPIYTGVRLVNNTGATISRVSFTYTGEQWFTSSATGNTFTLSSTYQLGATALTGGTWTSAATTFTAPIVSAGTATALDGNAAAHRRGVAGSIGGLAWAPGQELWVRISDSDQSGDEHGLAIDDFVFWAESGTALFLNGTSSYVTMAQADPLGAGALTLECWLLRTGAGASASTGTGGVTAVPLVAKGRGEADGSTLDCNYFMGINVATGMLAADFEAYPAAGITAGANYPAIGSTVLPYHQWTHVAATYDPTATDGEKWKLFVNGVKDTNTQPNPPAGAMGRYDSIQHFGLGTALNSNGTASGYLHGAIDEVRVWNLARTPAQIAAARDRRIAAPLPGLLARYGLDEAAGNAAGGTLPEAPAGAFVSSPVWVSGPPLAGNVAPGVTLTAPANGGSAQEPATLLLAATASDPDGEVARVEFLEGASVIGEDTAAPYEFTWTGVPSGSLVLRARVTDSAGATALSAPRIFNVTVHPNAAPVLAASAPAAGATGVAAPATLQVALSDATNDPLTVKFFGRRATPAPGPDFTVVTLPDTQFYSENIDGLRAATYHSQTQWIVDQRVPRKIAFVSHMGDIVQTGDNGGDPIEWQVADAAMARLENHATAAIAYGVPYGIAPGNHDLEPVGDQNGASVFFNQYFGAARFAGRTYYGGRYGTANNNNNYEFFSASGLDFLVIQLAYRSTADRAVIAWADALMKAHPHRRAIVTSHWFLSTGNPASWGGAAQMIYEGLKENPNFFLMLCGHVHGEGQRTDTYLGRQVYAVLQDYQGRANGGDGWLRYYEFSPVNNLIRARTYSTTLQQAETDADSEFTLPYNMQSPLSPWVELTAVNVPGGSAAATYVWPGLQAGLEYEWYATATDGVHPVSIAPRRFTVQPDLPPTVALSAPMEGTSYTPGVLIPLAATASDAEGPIVRVEFFQGGTRLGEDTTAPYGFEWSGAAPGPYALTAVARDTGGQATVSAVVNVTVNTALGSGSIARGPYLNFANDTGLVVRWRTSRVIVGRVRYGPSPTALTQFADDGNATTEHQVQIGGLAPHTRYFYSVGSAGDTVAGGDFTHTFRTSPSPGSATSTRIWVLGDCGTATANQVAVRDAYYGWTGTRTPDFCLMLGDNAYSSGTDAEYQPAVFDMYATFLRKMPLWSCLGNHETYEEIDPGDEFAYFRIFSFPTEAECGGVRTGTEHYYSFDYGNAHIICLDSMISDRSPTGMMAEWLRDDLAHTMKTWIIACFHHPPYTKGSHDSDNLANDSELVEMRENFLPILEEGGVDLVLGGHSHCYERSFLIDGHYGYSPTFSAATHVRQPGGGRPTGSGAYVKPLNGASEHFGAIYTVAGSAGQASGGSLDHPAMFISLNTIGSFNLDIDGPRLDATYIEGDGSVTDTFTILKSDVADSDGDRIPDTYETVHGLDRHNPADAALDLDRDGFSNLEEWVLGLLASTPDRYAWTVARSDPHIAVTCPTLAGRTYRVWFSSDLVTWQPASLSHPGDGQPFAWLDDGATTGGVPGAASRRFYRIAVTLP